MRAARQIGVGLVLGVSALATVVQAQPVALEAYLKASNAGALDQFGGDVSVSGGLLLCGAYGESSNATGVNAEQASNGLLDAGAAYAFRLELPECYLVIGDASGAALFGSVGHLFQTQLQSVQASHAVLMEDIPEFVLPDLWALASAGSLGAGPAPGAPVGPQLLPPWAWDGEFAVQILLWNPAVFPELPEQCSYGLRVRVLPGGGVLSAPFGTGTGIEVWAETDVNAQGQPVLRFPFTVPGV